MSSRADRPTRGPLVFLVAGEPSGDQLGARLMAALKAESGGRVRFAGVGGPQMEAQGLASLYSIDELSVMGIVEVLPHLMTIYRRMKQTVAAAERARPDILVTIDAPNFTLMVAKRLKGRGFPRVHYVAPSVWAWKPWRARGIARTLDHLLALLPFEPPYFERHGLAVTVVGHPVVEAAGLKTDPAAFRARHGIPAEAPLVAVLPGSRRSEIHHHEPVFAAALARLKARFSDLQAVVPTVATVADLVGERVETWPVPTTLLRDQGDKFQAFAAASAGLATSGTVAVELAVAQVPSVIAYRVGPVNAVIGRLLLRIRFASLVNLILDREVQPELLQEDCTPENLAAAVGDLMADGELRQAHLRGCREAAAALGLGGEAPSTKAARVILSLIGRERA